MKNRNEQDARHQQLVWAYYETGDSALLGPVLDELQPRLEGFFRYKRLHNPTLLADLKQDTIVAALSGLQRHKYKGTGTVASWLNEIGWHLYCQYLTRKANHITQPSAHDDPFRSLSLTDESEELPDAEDEARAKTLAKAIRELMQRLDTDTQSVVQLHYSQGLSVSEISQLLGITLHRCQARLRHGMSLLASWGKTQSQPTAGTYVAMRYIDTETLFG